MTDEHLPDEADSLELFVDEAQCDNEEMEYEEVSSEEVDRVVAVLEELIETVDSENIRIFLEDAVSSIYYLVYDTEDEDLDSGLSSEAA